jgi:hypothetical protein
LRKAAVVKHRAVLGLPGPAAGKSAETFDYTNGQMAIERRSCAEGGKARVLPTGTIEELPNPRLGVIEVVLKWRNGSVTNLSPGFQMYVIKFLVATGAAWG